MKRTIIWVGFLVLGLSACGVASAAFNVHIFLQADGNDIAGESSTTSMGPDDVTNSIEGYSLDHQVTSDGARVTHGEIRIVKRVDRASPQLHQALARAERIDATIWFYGRDEDSGAVERKHTWTLQQGRITGIAPWSPFTLDAETASQPFLEAVTITYTTLNIVSDTGSTEFQY